MRRAAVLALIAIFALAVAAPLASGRVTRDSSAKPETGTLAATWGNALDQYDARAGNQQKVWYFTTGPS